MAFLENLPSLHPCRLLLVEYPLCDRFHYEVVSQINMFLPTEIFPWADFRSLNSSQAVLRDSSALLGEFPVLGEPSGATRLPYWLQRGQRIQLLWNLA